MGGVLLLQIPRVQGAVQGPGAGSPADELGEQALSLARLDQPGLRVELSLDLQGVVAEGHGRVHPAAQQLGLPRPELAVPVVQQQGGHDRDVRRRENLGPGDGALALQEVDGEAQCPLGGLPGLLQRGFVHLRPDEFDVMSAGSREEAHEAQDGFPVQVEAAVPQFLVEGVHGVQAVGPASRDGAVHEVALGQPPAALVQPGEELGDLLVVVGLVGDDGDLVMPDVVHLLQSLSPRVEVRIVERHPRLVQHLIELHVFQQQGRYRDQQRILALNRARVDELLGAHVEAQIDEPTVSLGLRSVHPGEGGQPLLPVQQIERLVHRLVGLDDGSGLEGDGQIGLPQQQGTDRVAPVERIEKITHIGPHPDEVALDGRNDDTALQQVLDLRNDLVVCQPHGSAPNVRVIYSTHDNCRLRLPCCPHETHHAPDRGSALGGNGQYECVINDTGPPTSGPSPVPSTVESYP